MKEHPILRMPNGEWRVEYHGEFHWFQSKNKADRWLEGCKRREVQEVQGTQEANNKPASRVIEGPDFNIVIEHDISMPVSYPRSTTHTWEKYHFDKLEVNNGFVFPEGTSVREAHILTSNATRDLNRRFTTRVMSKDPLIIKTKRIPDDTPYRKRARRK